MGDLGWPTGVSPGLLLPSLASGDKDERGARVFFSRLVAIRSKGGGFHEAVICSGMI